MKKKGKDKLENKNGSICIYQIRKQRRIHQSQQQAEEREKERENEGDGEGER